MAGDETAEAVAAHASMRGRLRNAEDLKRFALAGRAVLTVQSTVTDKRFTLRLSTPHGKKGEERMPLFVALLTGDDNSNAYSFIGSCWPWDGKWDIRPSPRSRVAMTAPGAKAAQWMLRGLGSPQPWRLMQQARFWHEGKCGRCGRALTVPESIERGIGPDCWEQMGGAA